jgi:integrase
MSHTFRSWLAAQFERFVALKHAGGFVYATQERLLAGFDRYLVEQQPPGRLDREAWIAFLATLDRLSPRGRGNMIDVVWQALRFARLHGANVVDLPAKPSPAPPGFRLRPPRLVLHEEMAAIVLAARRLPPASSLRPATYATLYGLLFATGLRIGEALALDVDDFAVNAGCLTVRQGKFGKSRCLPLKASTIAALELYVSDPRRQMAKKASAPLFVTRRGRLSHAAAGATFKKLSQAAAVAAPLPRLHDIRHSFAVLRLADWYRTGRDLNALLPSLSTYLGHVCVENTRTYLQANALLLDEANQRFSRRSNQLDEVSR